MAPVVRTISTLESDKLYGDVINVVVQCQDSKKTCGVSSAETNMFHIPGENLMICFKHVMFNPQI